MNALRLPSLPEASLPRPVRATPARPVLAWPAWTDSQPMCFRSEAFAEDLPDAGAARALPLPAACAAQHAAVRSTLPAAMAAAVLAVLIAGAMGWWALGPGA